MKQIYKLLVRAIYIITWPLTGLIINNSNRVRVFVVKDNKVLLQKTSYSRQKWSLPGGNIELYETDVVAAQRELKEETGLTFNKRSFTKVGSKTMSFSRFGWPKMNVTFFKVKYTGSQQPKIVRPLEIVDLNWFDLSDLPNDTSQVIATATTMIKK